MQRYVTVVQHGEGKSLFQVVDTAQPERQQPAIIHTFDRRWLADDFCERHNTQAHNAIKEPTR